VSTVGAFAAEAMAEAIVRAARTATSAGGLPGLMASARENFSCNEHQQKKLGVRSLFLGGIVSFFA
jgi:L-aminopeptidase/D-esterase-like protein